MFEKVQRPVIKLLYDLSKLPYQTQLITLSLYSLFCGHQRGYLIEMCKILNKNFEIDPMDPHSSLYVQQLPPEVMNSKFLNIDQISL